MGDHIRHQTMALIVRMQIILRNIPAAEMALFHCRIQARTHAHAGQGIMLPKGQMEVLRTDTVIVFDRMNDQYRRFPASFTVHQLIV